MKSRFLPVFAVALCFLVSTRPAVVQALDTPERSERLILEEKHFVECLAYVYSPALWISYKGSLYFAPKNDSQVKQLEALKLARSRYVALTNREARYVIVSNLLAASGLDQKWQRKLLLPFSDEYPNLTPTLNRELHLVENYKIVQPLEEGDVLIQDHEATCVVMDFKAPLKREDTNSPLYLVKEGERAFAISPGQYKRVEAFAQVGLSTDEIVTLNHAVSCFQKQATALAEELLGFKEKREFEDSKARANDSNPYLQFVVARDYLEGKGTSRNEAVGWEWMKKAAHNGSGDAKSYLESRGRQAD